MKLGMPTLIEFKSLEENLKRCKELKLDFIELNMNIPIYTPEFLPAQELLDMKFKYGIDFTIHLPEEFDLSSFQPSIRQGHLDRCIETIDWAAKAQIKTINMHLNKGIYFTLPHTKVWINEQYEAEFQQRLYESYCKLYEYSNKLGVELCIENTANFHLPWVSRALDRLSEFDNFFLTWDVGHDAVAGFQEEPTFRRFSNRIKHMHLHDYNHKSDHQLVYSGVVPINERLQFAEDHQLTVVVEVKTSTTLAQSIEAIRNNYKRS
ncbi:hypothetical protein E0485_05155 [Paenibacillus albiflavus]|uniref:Xylose isomerase-like TIM barrel domain-containing protein n=1 Tax=Paenibacillus albiflavus TaxID=2545760 RepID=A0A4R4EJ45_9BACL|nr:TIM barrel protein [Paenibacillus albiflavus]TCZ79260.1 hypothetical protein E0485_05155 [Paenibacillus albiflavus]